MVSLTFDPIAFARCFMVADVLAEEFGQSFLEYGLIGLSSATRPLHVLHTPLLPGQRVTAATVRQSGSEVLRLRGEIEELSRRTGQELLPLTFVHRHPSFASAPSRTDTEFLRGVFLDQVSTLVTLPQLQSSGWAPAPCGCAESREGRAPHNGGEEAPGGAFSLIVTRHRTYSIQAAAKHWCAGCGTSRVSDVPVRVACEFRGLLPIWRLDGVRESLRQEIAEKFNPHDLEVRSHET
jgi:hypothetical protein